MDILIKILQVVLSISILVITHEGGHFFFAKLFKTRVEKFYLFFDPWFSLFKFKKGETEYGIGWLPLGGYVKISGMIDESMDKDQMAQPEQPWEFRAKPAWQRLFIMLGGVLVNFITAPILFWMILYVWGESYMPYNEAKFGLTFDQTMKEVGFENGDKILTINGREMTRYKDIANAILYEDECVVGIMRGDTAKEIKMPHEFFRTILSRNVSELCSPRIPTVIGRIAPDSNAEKAGLAEGDSLIGINGVETFAFDQFSEELSKLNGQETQIVLVRGGVTDTLTVSVSEEGKIGFNPYGAFRWMEAKHTDYGFFEALPAGIAKGYDLLCNYLKQIPLIFTKEGATKVGGFGTIGKMFPSVWDWESFWFNTAFLAIMLAVMNILPIPALDGGHVLFLIIEIVTRRKPSDKVLEYAQTAGMILLLGLMLYANGGDIIRAIFD